jgi:hypothetical protein
MRKELHRHKIAYLILFVGLAIFMVSFLAVWPDHILQRLLIAGVAIFYFLWGIATHFKADHISRNIILEYAGMAALASVLLLLVTW